VNSEQPIHVLSRESYRVFYRVLLVNNKEQGVPTGNIESEVDGNELQCGKLLMWREYSLRFCFKKKKNQLDREDMMSCGFTYLIYALNICTGKYCTSTYIGMTMTF
jgi:hypothetical protein